MSGTKPKKMVNRNIAIVFAVICIILAVGLVGAIAQIAQNSSLVSNRDGTISSLKIQNQNLTNSLNEAQADNRGLNNEISDLQNIANLNESKVVFLNETSGYLYVHDVGSGEYNYAGYVLVNVSSTVDTPFEFNYTFQGVTYDKQLDLGTNGTATFPILPTTLAKPPSWQ
jgi:hypothetical protein